MIELCDIFSLDNHLSSFRAISGLQYFTGHVWILLKFSLTVFAWRVAAEVCFHSFKIKIVCFERLIKSFDSVYGNAWEIQIKWPLRDREMKSTSDAILTFQRGEQNLSIMHFALPSNCKGLTLEGFRTFMDFCLRTRDRNVVDYLEVIDWMSILKKMMYFAELYAS